MKLHTIIIYAYIHAYSQPVKALPRDKNQKHSLKPTGAAAGKRMA
jgi:hypothetical protein